MSNPVVPLICAARGVRHRAGGARAPPRAGRRPALDARRRQPGDADLHGRNRRVALPAAGETSFGPRCIPAASRRASPTCPPGAAHILERLRRQIDVTADPVLIELMRELREYPCPEEPPPAIDYGGVIVPLQMKSDVGVLSFFGTTTVFGTPVEITLSELAIESFFPADPTAV
jgi:hypothetical protein